MSIVFYKLFTYHFNKLLLTYDRNAELLRFGQLASCLFACENVACFLGNRAAALAAVLLYKRFCLISCHIGERSRYNKCQTCQLVALYIRLIYRVHAVRFQPFDKLCNMRLVKCSEDVICKNITEILYSGNFFGRSFRQLFYTAEVLHQKLCVFLTYALYSECK